ncbi:MAG TPA: hypothetical protein VGV35_16280 [Bryobacteraceae bacterium]|nr:hypothetical protein [Bryobacteraceae bacterium]
MSRRALFAIATLAALAGSASAQTYSRRATMRGGGGPDRGKCTIEVVVDGTAEVEVRGDTAILRNLAGQPPQWRRFECSGVMPANPGDFRFQGIDGRGRQTLVRDPRNGGSAVVRIEDPQSGSEGYTFDLIWSGFGGAPPPNRGDDRDYRGDRDRGDRDRGGDRDQDAFHRDRAAWFRQDNWRGQIFQRVRQDVDHVRAVTFPVGGDQYRLAAVIQELDELQGKLAAGRYDQRELDDVIGAMQRVVRDNRLFPRDRDALNDDLSRLQDFRARHDYYGAREFGPRDEDAYHRDRDDRFRGEQWRQQFFQRIREDVQHVRAETFPFTGDQYRLVTVIQELDEMQGKLAQGRYDERELDDVIGALRRAVQDNRLSNRDRDTLNDDLNRLRDFRERHESYGAR